MALTLTSELKYKTVIPAPEPESIQQCLLNILEPPDNGYRIEPGTTGFFYAGQQCANDRFKKLSFSTAQ